MQRVLGGLPHWKSDGIIATGPLTHPFVGLRTFVPVNLNVAASKPDWRGVRLRSYRYASAGLECAPSHGTVRGLVKPCTHGIQVCQDIFTLTVLCRVSHDH